MDETPYQPPIETGAPQAVMPPPPPTPPAAYAAPAADAPKKSKTLVIVLVIVGVLLLCCIGTAIAGVVLFRTASSDVVSELESDLGTDITGDVAADALGAADPAWDEFDPDPFDTATYQPLADRDAALLDEIHGTLFPDFTIEEAVCEPGRYDGETYWMDALYVRATLDSDPDVRIVYPLWIQLEEGMADGSSSTDPDALDEGEVLETTADGTEFIYYDDLLPGLLMGVTDDALVPLLAQVQADFPGSYAAYAETDGDDGYATITKWNAYPDYAQGFDLTYVRADGTWEYVSSEMWNE